MIGQSFTERYWEGSVRFRGDMKDTVTHSCRWSPNRTMFHCPDTIECCCRTVDTQRDIWLHKLYSRHYHNQPPDYLDAWQNTRSPVGVVSRIELFHIYCWPQLEIRICIYTRPSRWLNVRCWCDWYLDKACRGSKWTNKSHLDKLEFLKGIFILRCMRLVNFGLLK